MIAWLRIVGTIIIVSGFVGAFSILKTTNALHVLVSSSNDSFLGSVVGGAASTIAQTELFISIGCIFAGLTIGLIMLTFARIVEIMEANNRNASIVNSTTKANATILD